MKKMNRILSSLLCLALLLTLLPAAAMAATEIREVRLSIDEPTAGMPADFTPSGTNGQFGIRDYNQDNYHGGVRWLDNTDFENPVYLEPGDLLVGGHSYRVQVVTYAKSGYAMIREQLDGAFLWHVTGYINEYKDTYPSFRGDSSDVVFSAQIRIPGELESVAVRDLNAPVPGAHPDYEADTPSSLYALSTQAVKGNFRNGVYWYDLTESRVMVPADTFVKGHRYRVFVDLLVTGADTFAVDGSGNPAVTATVNGQEATAIKYLSEDPAKENNLYYDFGECQPISITNVKIENLAIPMQGNAPDYEADLLGTGFSLKPTSAGNPFCVNGVTWHDETAGYDLTATDKFIAGHTYSVSVYLVPDDGFRFAEEVIATIDDYAATVTGNGSEIEVRHTYPALLFNRIDDVSIEGVSAPVLGQLPSYVATVRGEGYHLKEKDDGNFRNGMRWSVIDGESLPPTGSAAFAGGKAYQLEILLTAEDGYVFAADVNGSPELKATVNGKEVTAAFSEGALLLTCYFPEPTDEATVATVMVDGLSAPVIGAAPDYTADIIDTRYALQDENSANEKNGITWFNNETGNAMKVGLEKFEAGVSYTVVIGLDSSEGYAFSPEVIAYLNERQVDEVTVYSEYEIYLWFTFAALPGTAFLDVPTNAYYYEPVVWAVANGITNGTGDGSTFSPDMNCTRAQVVTFLWRAAGAPEPVSTENPFTDIAEGSYYYKAVLWAVENHITTGTGKGRFSPDMDCSRAQIVTFLWRSQTSPAPTGTEIPFTDVQPGQYYTNAVLWAVERGITTGTGNGSTFSPDMICTRAQIVTFLYRCPRG